MIRKKKEETHLLIHSKDREDVFGPLSFLVDE